MRSRSHLLTLNYECSQLGGQFKGDGQSALQDVLLDLQKQLVPGSIRRTDLSGGID